MNRESIRQELIAFLQQVVKNDYVLLDLPYFPNVGDVLIWQSILDLLKAIPHRCLYSSSIETYRKPNIESDIIIIFMGGGNFGDLWIRHQYFRQRVLTDFPDNPIVQLPQSVCFQDAMFMTKDISMFTAHRGKVTLCLRDHRSFDIISHNYHGVDTRLLPDMVLAFDIEKYCQAKRGNGILYVKRHDSEQAVDKSDVVPNDAYVADWPTMEHKSSIFLVYAKFLKICIKVDRLLQTRLASLFMDICWKGYLKKYVIHSGLDFVNTFEKVYTTRLHVGIISALMNKQTIMFDNSYGKIKGVYDLWMKNWKNVQIA